MAGEDKQDGEIENGTQATIASLDRSDDRTGGVSRPEARHVQVGGVEYCRPQIAAESLAQDVPETEGGNVALSDSAGGLSPLDNTRQVEAIAEPQPVGDSGADEVRKPVPPSNDTPKAAVLPFRVKPLSSVSSSVSDTERHGKTDTEKKNVRFDSSKSKTFGMREIRERWENADGSTGCRYLGCVSEAMYPMTRKNLIERRRLGYGTSKISNAYTDYIGRRFRTSKQIRAKSS